MRNRLLVMYCAYLGEGWRAKTTCRKILWAPSAKTWPHVRRSCNSDQMRGAARPIGISSAGVGLQSPVSARVGRDDKPVERGTEHRHRRSATNTPPLCSDFPSEPTAGSGNVRRFPESEVISDQPATRQATAPICHLRNLAIRTQTPGAERASHVTRRKCCRAKCIQCRLPRTLTQQID